MKKLLAALALAAALLFPVAAATPEPEPADAYARDCTVIWPNGSQFYAYGCNGYGYYRVVALCQGWYGTTWRYGSVRTVGSANWFSSGYCPAGQSVVTAFVQTWH